MLHRLEFQAYEPYLSLGDTAKSSTSGQQINYATCMDARAKLEVGTTFSEFPAQEAPTFVRRSKIDHIARIQ